MTLNHPTRSFRPRPCLIGVCARVVGLALVVGNAHGMASEVISAIPAAIDPLSTEAPADVGDPGSCAGPRHAHGGRCNGARCTHGRCGHGACRHDGCEVPGCPAHCPVRPATFGYYDTQWRTWPGHGIEQASRTQPAAPVMPPKSEVPTADEESPVPGFEFTPGDSPEAAPADQLQPDGEPSILPPPGAEERPGSELPAKPSDATPADEKPADAKPAEDAPAKEKSDDANLFDEANLRRRSQERLALLGQAAVQQERLRREALRQQATRIGRPSAAGATVKQATHLEAEPRRRPR